MSQTDFQLAPAPFAGEVPPNLTCGFCGHPIESTFYRTLNRFACSNCAAQVDTVRKRNTFAIGPFVSAAALGLAAALAGGAVWGAVVHATHWQIGFVASFIGIGIGKMILRATGNRRGLSLQILSAILAATAILFGRLVLDIWTIVDALRANGESATVSRVSQVFLRVLVHAPQAMFEAFDLLWIGIAVYATWRLCKAPPITIAGPYAYDPSPAGSLQFRIAEPAVAPSSPLSIQPEAK